MNNPRLIKTGNNLMVDIAKYTSFFHDGSVMDINHSGNGMIILMESAEVDEEDLENPIPLSNEDRIRGKLHIAEIENVLVDKTPFFQPIVMTYDDGGILHLEVGQNFVELAIEWVNFPPKEKIEEFSVIKIEANKIWWENIPC